MIKKISSRKVLCWNAFNACVRPQGYTQRHTDLQLTCKSVSLSFDYPFQLHGYVCVSVLSPAAFTIWSPRVSITALLIQLFVNIRYCSLYMQNIHKTFTMYNKTDCMYFNWLMLSYQRSRSSWFVCCALKWNMRNL